MGKVFSTTLLQRELTRKEFLQYMLGFFVVALGISNFLATIKKLETHGVKSTIPQTTTRSHGFGSSKFGV